MRFEGSSSPLRTLQSRRTSPGERRGREQEGSAGQGARVGHTVVRVRREAYRKH